MDNLKEGVIKPDLYDPDLNPLYAAMLAHYHVVADPARVGDANRKGTVENAVKYTQKSVPNELHYGSWVDLILMRIRMFPRPKVIREVDIFYVQTILAKFSRLRVLVISLAGLCSQLGMRLFLTLELGFRICLEAEVGLAHRCRRLLRL